MTKLTIELVPKTSWCSNLRSELSRGQWDKVRKATYKKANHHCEVCGKQGKRHPVEAHEVWEYDDSNHIQTLVGMQALCPTCHRVKHAGRTIFVEGREGLVIGQLMRVNQWPRGQAESYIMDAFAKHKERSRHSWKVDIEWIWDFLMEINE